MFNCYSRCLKLDYKAWTKSCIFYLTKLECNYVLITILMVEIDSTQTFGTPKILVLDNCKGFLIIYIKFYQIVGEKIDMVILKC